jgi:heat shock protein HtpX
VSGNKHRAIALVVGSAALVAFVVAAVASLLIPGVAALAAGLVVGLLVAAAAWWGSVPLALHFLGAEPADPVIHARLFNLVEGLGANAGVPQPALFVVSDPGLNALTMGRSARHAVLVVTTGLLDQLSRMELEAVLAHELSHIRSEDIVAATVAVVLFGWFGGPARAATDGGGRALLGYLLLPLSAVAGVGLQLSMAPHREELADTAGVHLTRYPPAMVTALEKMQRQGTIVRRGGAPAISHLWLGGPLPPPPSARMAWLTRLFDTHPPLDERIEALREL